MVKYEPILSGARPVTCSTQTTGDDESSASSGVGGNRGAWSENVGHSSLLVDRPN